MHPDIARTLAGQAGLAQARNSLAVARSLYERALCMLEVTLGPQHREVANLLHSLALLLHAQVHLTRQCPILRCFSLQT